MDRRHAQGTPFEGSAVADQAQTYVWNWFTLHSNQRMALVNFWLVATAFLAGGVVTAITARSYALAAVASFATAAVAVVFWRLDARTRALTQLAEIALRRLEDQWATALRFEELRLVAAAEATKSPFSSYRVVLGALQLAAAAAFTVCGLASLWQLTT